jgi:hypothetical protein
MPVLHANTANVLFLVGIIACIVLLIPGVVRHWRWVFWLMLVAFGGSVLQIPVTLLQVADVLPNADPLWYSLFRMGVAMVEIGIAVWMIQIYRRNDEPLKAWVIVARS